MTLNVTLLVVEEDSCELEEQFALEEGIVLEPEVCSELVWLVIVQDVIAINSPSSGNPLMELLVDDSLFGELIFELFLCRDLELSVDSLALIEMVLGMSMTVISMSSMVIMAMLFAVSASTSH